VSKNENGILHILLCLCYFINILLFYFFILMYESANDANVKLVVKFLGKSVQFRDAVIHFFKERCSDR